MFTDGNGGINAAGIKLALEAEEIPLKFQQALIRSILLFVMTGIKTQRGD